MRALAFFALLLMGCEQPTAAVECSPVFDGYQCQLSHQAGPKLEACWNISVECGNGIRTQANACQIVEPQGKATRVVPASSFPRSDECDRVVALNVVDMVVEGRQ